MKELERAVPVPMTMPPECADGCPPQQVCDYCAPGPYTDEPISEEGKRHLETLIRAQDANRAGIRALATSEAVVEELQAKLAAAEAEIRRLNRRVNDARNEMWRTSTPEQFARNVSTILNDAVTRPGTYTYSSPEHAVPLVAESHDEGQNG